MATITKRATGWSVQVRRRGYAPEYKTLPTKADAQRWARERESMIDRGEQPISRRDLQGLTLGDLIRRYMREVTPKKRSEDTELARLGKMLKAPVSAVVLADLTAGPIASYRDERAKEVKPGTIARELSLLHNVIDIARREWGVGLTSNVVAQVTRLPVRNARNRRLEPGELKKLEKAMEKTRNKLVRFAVLFAVETALRRGELLGLTWDAIDKVSRTAHIPNTKTGYPRTIPLSGQAIAILEGLKTKDKRVFPLSAMALRLSWNRIRDRAGMPDLHFHDLRHEAISRFAELGLSTVELAVISGHRDLRMLARYTHLRPADLARKLAGRSWEREVGLTN